MSAFRRRLMAMQGETLKVDEFGYADGKSYFFDCIQEGSPEGTDNGTIALTDVKTIEIRLKAAPSVTFFKIFGKNNFGAIWTHSYENYYGTYASFGYNESIDLSEPHTFVFVLQDNSFNMYIDGVYMEKSGVYNNQKYFQLPEQKIFPSENKTVYSIRAYPRILQPMEIINNYNIDKIRFDS